jgi:hypothetical protein
VVQGQPWTGSSSFEPKAGHSSACLSSQTMEEAESRRTAIPDQPKQERLRPHLSREELGVVVPVTQ